MIVCVKFCKIVFFTTFKTTRWPKLFVTIVTVMTTHARSTIDQWLLFVKNFILHLSNKPESEG